MKNSSFYKQAELMLRCLAPLNQHKDFALKGGTALNFFIFNLPRLSVDIDLVYLPEKDYEGGLKAISNELELFKNRIWSKVYETDGHRHTWEYAFFVKIKHNQFITFDIKRNPQVAISTYDMGTGVIRWTILFQVRKDRLEVINELDGFNVAADDPIFH